MNVQTPKRLAVIDGETLMDARLPKRSFCVETLLPEGISILGGAPKVGKSWMVLLLALQIAKGEQLWNLPTKQGDSYPLNKLSGTTGISGAMDAVFILDRSKRNANGATLFCTGRDIESREIEIQLKKENCEWELKSDSLEEPTLSQPEEITLLIEMMKQLQSFDGGNTELTEKFNSFSGKNISAKALKQIMNKWRYTLEENDVFFTSGRSNGKRYIKTWYLPSADESDGSAV